MNARVQWPTAALAMVSIMFAACDSGSGPTDPTPPGVATITITAQAATVDVGTTLQASAVIQPSDAPQGVTWSSSSTQHATVDATGLVTGVNPGPVTITATSTADPARQGTLELTVTGCGTLAATAVANGATLPANTCYVVQSPLTVSGGTLAVGEGVRIGFEPNAHLIIQGGGRLNARGTESNPVTFTSTEPAAKWRGIHFNGSMSAENVLHHVVIENGGSSGWSGAAYSTSALLLQGNTLVDIQNSTIRGSGGQGITLYEGAQMVFENNTLTQNAVAAWVHPNTAGYLSSSTTIEDNTDNTVRVVFGGSGTVTRAQTWPGLTYTILNRVTTNAHLTLAPAARLEFAEGASMIVGTGGALTAVGEIGKRILFTGAEPIPGYWQGLQITTASLQNRFYYADFEYGGGQAWTGAPDSRAMVYMTDNSKALFEFSTFTHSAHYGLWVPEGGDIDGFIRNQFTFNARPMIIHPNRVGQLTQNNTGRFNVFRDNTENMVRVSFGNNNAVTTAQTWHLDNGGPGGVSFLITGRTLIRAPLTIEPHTFVDFAQGASLIVEQGGSLNAAGDFPEVTGPGHTPTQRPVTFRGHEDLPGYWQGIQFATASANNKLTHAYILNAGSTQWHGGAYSTAAIHVTATGRVALDNVLFDQSSGYAAVVQPGGTLSCEAVDSNGLLFYNVATSQALASCWQ